MTAGCNADNPASARVLAKNGMRREQHGIEDSWHAELGWVDGYQYAILAREWHARRTADRRWGEELFTAGGPTLRPHLRHGDTCTDPRARS